MWPSYTLHLQPHPKLLLYHGGAWCDGYSTWRGITHVGGRVIAWEFGVLLSGALRSWVWRKAADCPKVLTRLSANLPEPIEPVSNASARVRVWSIDSLLLEHIKSRYFEAFSPLALPKTAWLVCLGASQYWLLRLLTCSVSNRDQAEIEQQIVFCQNPRLSVIQHPTKARRGG